MSEEYSYKTMNGYRSHYWGNVDQWNFSLNQDQEFINNISNSTTPLLGNDHLLSFGVLIREEYPQLHEKAVRVLLPYNCQLCRLQLYSYSSSKVT